MTTNHRTTVTARPYFSRSCFGFVLTALLLAACGNKAEEEAANAKASAEQAATAAKEAADQAAQETAKKMEQLREIAEKQAEPADDHPTIEGECGGEVEGQALCPMEQWMEDNTKAAVEERDLKALAAALHKMEFMAPVEEWNEGENGWAQIARRGAVAAEKGDFKEARASCKSCHNEHKDAFQEKYRKRLMPELPEGAEKGRTDLKI